MSVLTLAAETPCSADVAAANLAALEDEALASRVADYALGLIVALVAAEDGAIVLRILSRDGAYDETRRVPDGDAVTALHHPFAFFTDLPSPWQRGDSIGSADDNDDNDGGSDVVDRVNDYTGGVQQ